MTDIDIYFLALGLYWIVGTQIWKWITRSERS
jgi:hypothetical protein